MAGKIKEIQGSDYEKEVLSSERAVVDFYSTECPPCEALASKYEVLSELYGDDIKFFKIFRQGNRALSEELSVSGSPTVIFYKNGERTGDTLSGGIKRSELIKNLNSLLEREKVEEIEKNIKPLETRCQALVLGGGPAGLTAGIYLAQAHIDTILVDTALPGGYVSTTHQVSNYPGFIDPQPGFMIAHYMGEQAKGAGVKVKAAVDVTSVNLDKKEVVIDGYETIKADKIIVATGSSPRPLSVPGENEYRGNGISYCATCDAKYFEGKDVVVIGGGNSAVEESLFISRFADKVTVVHQFAELQANMDAQKKAFADEKISFLFEHEPREFIKHGNMDMEVAVEDLKTGKKKSLKTNGVFVFVGFIPNLNGFENKFDVDKWGYVVTDDEMRTNIDSVYAVGDLRTKAYRQITTAVADGTIAAISISKEL